MFELWLELYMALEKAVVLALPTNCGYGINEMFSHSSTIQDTHRTASNREDDQGH